MSGYFQSFLSFTSDNRAWIMELIMLTVGGLLLARGLKIYKAVQAIVCATIGASIGLFIQSYFGKQELYIVALVLAALGLFLGIRYYKLGLYIMASSSAWIAVFSYFWKQAIAELKNGLDGLIDAKQFLILWLENSLKTEDLVSSLTEVVTNESDEIKLVIENALHTMQTGLMWAGIVGIVVGILALVIGDFIIIFATSSLGATILIGLLEVFLELIPNIHLLVLIMLIGVGIVLQSIMKNGS